MRLIKLDAIGSTNDFLKEMLQAQTVENFTIVSAQTQYAGKGQRGSSWFSEPGKNIIMSMLVQNGVAFPRDLFVLNAAVAVAVVTVLQRHAISGLSVKWPNDILSGNKKIGGILIENSLQTNRIESIIGLGLNVNQADFETLPQASSLFCITGKVFDKDALVLEIAQQIQSSCQGQDWQQIWDSYDALLFKKDQPSAFEDVEGKRFMGIIRNVTREGRLTVEREDEKCYEYDLKALKMLY